MCIRDSNYSIVNNIFVGHTESPAVAIDTANRSLEEINYNAYYFYGSPAVSFRVHRVSNSTDYTYTSLSSMSSAEGYEANGIEGTASPFVADQDAILGRDRVVNGNFAAWTGDNPDGWTLVASDSVNREVSEVGTGAFHNGAGTGSCNIWTDNGSGVGVKQDLGTVVGRKYRATFVHASQSVGGSPWSFAHYNGTGINSFSPGSSGTYTTDYIAIGEGIQFKRGAGATDFTIDNVVVQEISIATLEQWEINSSDGNFPEPLSHATHDFRLTAGLTPDPTDNAKNLPNYNNNDSNVSFGAVQIGSTEPSYGHSWGGMSFTAGCDGDTFEISAPAAILQHNSYMLVGAN